MSLSSPRVLFGVHAVSAYSRTDGSFYGTLRVLGGSSLNMQGQLIELYGGSQKYNWAVEEGRIQATLSLKTREYPDFVFELFGGIAPTANAAQTSGDVSTLTNKFGTSVMSATTGIATATALSGSEANLKFGKVVVKAVSATTVDVFFSSDIDFARGTDGSYTTDLLKIAAAQTITASTATNFATYGFKLTGGSGTIGMVTGDTATFQIQPNNTSSMVASFGKMTAVYPEFGAIIYAKKKGNGEMFEVDAPRCKGEGVPLLFDENKFSEADIKVMLMYDSTLDYVFQVRTVIPTTVN